MLSELKPRISSKTSMKIYSGRSALRLTDQHVSVAIKKAAQSHFDKKNADKARAELAVSTRGLLTLTGGRSDRTLPVIPSSKRQLPVRATQKKPQQKAPLFLQGMNPVLVKEAPEEHEETPAESIL